MKIEITVEVKDQGFYGHSKKHSISATGKSLEEMQANLVEALNYYTQFNNIVVSKSNLRLVMDFRHFFKNYGALNASYLAARIGMNPTLLSHYISGKKIPSAGQAKKIYKGVKAIGKELMELALRNEHSK